MKIITYYDRHSFSQVALGRIVFTPENEEDKRFLDGLSSPFDFTKWEKNDSGDDTLVINVFDAYTKANKV